MILFILKELAGILILTAFGCLVGALVFWQIMGEM